MEGIIKMAFLKGIGLFFACWIATIVGLYMVIFISVLLVSGFDFAVTTTALSEADNNGMNAILLVIGFFVATVETTLTFISNLKE